MQFTRKNSTILAAGAAVIVIGLIVLFGTGNGEGDDVALDPDEFVVHDGLAGMQEVQNDELGIAFSYQAGEGGYRLSEPPRTAYGEDSLRHAYVLIEEAAYRAIEAGEDPGEAPPTMTIFVFDDTAGGDLRAWAETHDAFSNFNLLRSVPETVTFAGTEALTYRADGLYASDVYVAAHEGLIYLFVGSFIDADSELRSDFDALLATVRFI